MTALYRICISIALLYLAGCTSLSYYRQSIWGHLEAVAKSRPITEWLTEKDLNKDLGVAR